MVETLASGYGLVEGPTVDGEGNLYFSDVLGGGVYRRDPDGDITTVVPKRRGVGGIVLHADGGVVVSGRDIVHVRDGENRTLYSIDGVPGWNDICADSAGRVYAGSIRFAVFDPDATPVPLVRQKIGSHPAGSTAAENHDMLQWEGAHGIKQGSGVTGILSPISQKPLTERQ